MKPSSEPIKRSKESPMPYTMIQSQSFLSSEEDLIIFTIYGLEAILIKGA